MSPSTSVSANAKPIANAISSNTITNNNKQHNNINTMNTNALIAVAVDVCGSNNNNNNNKNNNNISSNNNNIDNSKSNTMSISFHTHADYNDDDDGDHDHDDNDDRGVGNAAVDATVIYDYKHVQCSSDRGGGRASASVRVGGNGNGCCGGAIVISKTVLPTCLLLILCGSGMLTFSGTMCVSGATTNHKQYRSAGLFAWNNFTDLQGASTGDLSAEKGVGVAAAAETAEADAEAAAAEFTAESSVIATSSKTNSGCPETTSSHCLRCNSNGCIKCVMYLVTDTRQCVNQCPSGYIDQWSAHTEFMGRVCVSTGYSGPVMAALAGLLGGFLVCFSLLAMAVMLVRRKRRRKSIKQKLINENAMDRSDFLRQLNDMRPNAEYFLAMLNDTRRQIRKLYLSGEVAAANSYRPIVRDLAKILILLNRPIELIPSAPHDWNRLYAWSEQALERYKPQVGQLIDFFQSNGGGGGGRGGGSSVADDFEVAPVYTPKGGPGSGGGSLLRQSANTLQSSGTSTAKPSSTQKLHLFGSLISLHEFEEPRASDPFGSSFNTLKGGNLISDLNASSLWLEDEFYKLGFRPQDEITTEL